MTTGLRANKEAISTMAPRPPTLFGVSQRSQCPASNRNDCPARSCAVLEVLAQGTPGAEVARLPDDLFDFPFVSLGHTVSR